MSLDREGVEAIRKEAEAVLRRPRTSTNLSQRLATNILLLLDELGGDLRQPVVELDLQDRDLSELDVQRALACSELLLPEQHLPGCPVREGASLNCVAPAVCCVFADFKTTGTNSIVVG